MEKLLNEFTVNRPIEETWAALTDVERIAPCLPGAELQEIEGDLYRGVVKVKLGPVSTAFKGHAQFVERDDVAHRAALKCQGRDTGGKGNADALITAQLEAVSTEITKCVVATELHITGKVAQFGRGIMGEVSEKLMGQFAHNLNTMLDNTGLDNTGLDNTVLDNNPPDAGSAEGAEPPAEVATGHEPDVKAQPEAPAVRLVHGPAAEPIELSNVAGTAVLKRLLPLFGGLVLLLLILRRMRK